jgi:hypothetical protein
MSLARYLSKLGALLGSDGKVPAEGIADAAVTAAKLASGAARANFGAGAVLQVVNENPTLSFSTSSGTFASIGLSASITPSSATSKILVLATYLESSQTSNVSLQTSLFRVATQLNITTGQYAASAGWLQTTNTTTFLDSPSTTSPVTYTIQARVSAGAGTLSFSDKSSITLMEIAA